VAKRLTGSGCRLGDEWGRSRDGCIRWDGDRRRGRGSFGVNVGRLIETIETLLRRPIYCGALFPNYFGRTCFSFRSVNM